MTFAVAAGAHIVASMAILQQTASAIGGARRSARSSGRATSTARPTPASATRTRCRRSRSSSRPTAARATFKVVILDTAAYEALYAKRADFTIPFTAWEGVEAELRGIELRYFQFTDYGFPDFYQVVLACDRRVAGAASRTPRGGSSGRRSAASSSRPQRPGRGRGDPRRPRTPACSTRTRSCRRRAQEFLASGGYLVDAPAWSGRRRSSGGAATPAFLYEQGLLTDADGKPLTQPPDYASLFTNDFLP